MTTFAYISVWGLGLEIRGLSGRRIDDRTAGRRGVPKGLGLADEIDHRLVHLGAPVQAAQGHGLDGLEVLKGGAHGGAENDAVGHFLILRILQQPRNVTQKRPEVEFFQGLF